MPSFQELFSHSRGKPIEYQGKILHLVDWLPENRDRRVRVVFESINSDWQQGVALKVKKGEFEIDGETVRTMAVLWCKSAPCEFIVRIKSKQRCYVKNVWDVGDGVMHSWHNGAAMIIEETLTGRRYRCNDGRPDDDFDDLIFRIEFLPISDVDKPKEPKTAMVSAETKTRKERRG